MPCVGNVFFARLFYVSWGHFVISAEEKGYVTHFVGEESQNFHIFIFLFSELKLKKKEERKEGLEETEHLPPNWTIRDFRNSMSVNEWILCSSKPSDGGF